MVTNGFEGSRVADAVQGEAFGTAPIPPIQTVCSGEAAEYQARQGKERKVVGKSGPAGTCSLSLSLLLQPFVKTRN
jgi:hypothetical protein